MKMRFNQLLLFSLFCSLPLVAQEGNSSLERLKENKDAKEIYNSLTNNPEATLKKAQENPEDLVKNAISLLKDTQTKRNPGEVPATRSSKTTAEKSLSNIKSMIATPVDPADPPGRTLEERLRDSKIDQDQLEKVKAAARNAIPALGSDSLPDQLAIPMPEPISIPAPLPGSSSAKLADTPPAPLVPRAAPVLPVRTLQATTPLIPDSVELAAAAPAPVPLEPRYAKPRKFVPSDGPGRSSITPKPGSDTMVITANESIMDRNKRELTFRGDVIVEMKDMEMTCDRLLVELDSNDKMDRITATGGLVQIRRVIVEDGKEKIQVAKSRKAVYESSTGTATITGGPPYLQNGDQYMNTDSEDAEIVLGGDGKYVVHTPPKKTTVENSGRPGGGRTVIVVPISGGKDKLEDLNKLDSKMKGLNQ